jgi:protein involved in ribonucleotide reduction
MLIVFYSETGNTEEFIEKTGLQSMEIITGTEEVNEQFVIVTPTIADGDVPDVVLDFLEDHADKVVAVAAGGSLAWEETYCFAADRISERFNIPVLLKFEDEGTDEDVAAFVAAVEKL